MRQIVVGMGFLGDFFVPLALGPRVQANCLGSVVLNKPERHCGTALSERLGCLLWFLYAVRSEMKSAVLIICNDVSDEHENREKLQQVHQEQERSRQILETMKDGF